MLEKDESKGKNSSKVVRLNYSSVGWSTGRPERPGQRQIVVEKNDVCVRFRVNTKLMAHNEISRTWLDKQLILFEVIEDSA